MKKAWQMNGAIIQQNKKFLIKLLTKLTKYVIINIERERKRYNDKH